MERERTSIISTRAGGLLGTVLFLIFGLKPALVYGGFLGIITAAAMKGGPVGEELVSRLVIAGGMFIGVLAVGFMMTVAGALVGTAFHYLFVAPLAKARSETAMPAAKKA